MPGTAFSASDRFTCGRSSCIDRVLTVSIESGRSKLSRSTRVAVTVTSGPDAGAAGCCAIAQDDASAAGAASSVRSARLKARFRLACYGCNASKTAIWKGRVELFENAIRLAFPARDGFSLHGNDCFLRVCYQRSDPSAPYDRRGFTRLSSRQRRERYRA